MAETKTVFQDNGYVSRRKANGELMYGYDIVEYENGFPVYQYTGIYRGGDTMTLYPHRAIVKGTVREKRSVQITELVRNRKKE